MYRESNFVQFANRTPPSLKFSNHKSRSKVKCVYKLQIPKKCDFKWQMWHRNHKSVIYKWQMWYINSKNRNCAICKIRKLVCGLISAQWYFKTTKTCTFGGNFRRPTKSKQNGGDRSTCTTAFHSCLPSNQWGLSQPTYFGKDVDIFSSLFFLVEHSAFCRLRWMNSRYNSRASVTTNCLLS